MTIGIIGAMQMEIENLKPSIQNATTETISGIPFIKGDVHGVEIVAAVSGVFSFSIKNCFISKPP